MKKRNPRVLVVDDDSSLLEMMRMTLVKEGYNVQTASSASGARQALEESDYELVVSDIYLGDASAIDLLDEIQAANPEAPIILVTAQGTVETAAAASAAGVFDYLAKPFRIGQLVERVQAALSKHDESAEPSEPGPESMIVGNHPSIVEVYKAVARVAPVDVPVLIGGETGTGKELVARALHRFGVNPDGPFVAINCGAIPESLLESELFGHRRGSFTGAERDHKGAIESARNGTVLLDEVGELPSPMQVKLLRFLQEGEIRPIGSNSTVKVDARVVAATHRNLRAEAEAGTFREDFFYRLSAYEITLPPLRDRATDIPLLIEHFRTRTVDRLGIDTAAPPTKDVLKFLEDHHWPGNVRELENLVQRALIDHGSLDDAEGIRNLLSTFGPKTPTDSGGPSLGDDLTIEEVERLHIEAVLSRLGGNRTNAAAVLGIDRKSLYRKIGRLGIEIGSSKP